MLGFGLGLNKWRRVGGGYVGLLDLFPNAAAAYSLRKLRAAYSGAAVRVRESGGNTEADIGFTSAGELDTSALLAHCGANDGFVTVWYDQSLSNDATQTTASNQPKIVSAGSLVTENGKAAIEFDGANDYMVSNSAYPTQTTETHFYVASSTGTNNRVLDTRGTGGTGNVKGWHHKFSNIGLGDVSTIDDGAGAFILSQGIVRTGQKLVSVSFSTTAITEYTNGVLSDNDSGSVTDFDSGNNLYIGANVNGANSQRFGGTMQIIVLYNSNQSANRTSIETNINNFYSIYP